jgi:uncharacterized protein YegP (UPF0339 family)
MTAKFEVYQGQDDEYRWRLKAANGEVVAHGESHTRTEDARRGVAAVKAAAAAAPDLDPSDEPFWGTRRDTGP